MLEIHSDNGLVGVLHNGRHVSEALICVGKLGGADAHALFQFQVEFSYFLFDLFPLAGIHLQRLVRLFQVFLPALRQPGGTNQHETLRNQRRQDDGSGNGSRGRHEFDGAGKPISCNPERPDLHEVGCAAGQDEHSERHEYPGEG